LPLPVSVRTTEEVEMDWSEPPTLIEFSRNCSEAPPLKRPRGFASTTVPLAAAPAGIAVLPSTETGLASVAVKVSPAELIFEPTACPRRTVKTVPAGTIKARAGSGFMFDIAVLDMADPVPPLGAGEEVLLSLDAGAVLEEGEELESAGAAGLLQPTRAKAK